MACIWCPMQTFWLYRARNPPPVALQKGILCPMIGGLDCICRNEFSCLPGSGESFPLRYSINLKTQGFAPDPVYARRGRVRFRLRVENRLLSMKTASRRGEAVIISKSVVSRRLFYRNCFKIIEADITYTCTGTGIRLYWGISWISWFWPPLTTDGQSKRFVTCFYLRLIRRSIC